MVLDLATEVVEVVFFSLFLLLPILWVASFPGSLRTPDGRPGIEAIPWVLGNSSGVPQGVVVSHVGALGSSTDRPVRIWAGAGVVGWSKLWLNSAQKVSLSRPETERLGFSIESGRELPMYVSAWLSLAGDEPSNCNLVECREVP